MKYLLSFTLSALMLTTPLHAEWNVKPRSEWNPETRVWDPAPELKLTFEWTGGSDSAGRADGYGKLSWYKDYEFVSRYEGQLVAGKRSGEGRWQHKSGAYYDGEWKNNLKHGKGFYNFSNGDTYEGAYVEDKMHGMGVYVSSDGSVYEGGFAGDKRHGQGKLTIAGKVVETTWNEGQPADPIDLKPSSPYLTVRADLKKYLPASGVLGLDGASRENYITYLTKPTREGITIYPVVSYHNAWAAGGPVGDLVGQVREFLGYGAHPAYLELTVHNVLKQPITIEEAEFLGAESFPDLEPVLDISNDGCSMPVDYLDVINIGPGKPQSVSIKFKFQELGDELVWSGYQHESTMVTVKDPEHGYDEFRLPIAAAMKDLNMDAAYLKEAGNLPYSEVALTKAMGDLAKYATKGNGYDDSEPDRISALMVGIVGELTYTWLNHKEAPESKVVKFAISHAFFAPGPECGAAGPNTGTFDIKLPLRAENYVRPFNFQKVVKPGENVRFSLRLACEAPSYHNFRIRLRTADGQEILSPLCNMHLYDTISPYGN